MPARNKIRPTIRMAEAATGTGDGPAAGGGQTDHTPVRPGHANGPSGVNVGTPQYCPEPAHDSFFPSIDTSGGRGGGTSSPPWAIAARISFAARRS